MEPLKHPALRGPKPRYRSPTHAARLLAWRAWWTIRPGGRPSARALSERMAQSALIVQRYAAGTMDPDETALVTLEILSGAYGFVPSSSDQLFL